MPPLYGNLTNNVDQNACGDSRADNAGNIRTHGVHEQEVGGILLLTDLLRDASRHRNGRNAGGTDQRIDLAACHLVHDLAEEHAEGGTHAERDQTEKDDLERLKPEEVGAGGGRADSGAEENGDDIHQFILRRLGDTLDHAALLEEVAEHQHTLSLIHI